MLCLLKIFLAMACLVVMMHLEPTDFMVLNHSWEAHCLLSYSSLILILSTHLSRELPSGPFLSGPDRVGASSPITWWYEQIWSQECLIFLIWGNGVVRKPNNPNHNTPCSETSKIVIPCIYFLCGRKSHELWERCKMRSFVMCTLC